VPNGLRPEFRRNLLNGGVDGFRALFKQIAANLNVSFGGMEGAVPSVEVIQRRYPSQRAEPIIDADLVLDLRTAFEEFAGSRDAPKYQPQWLDAAYYALENRDSNLQLGIGAKLYYDRCIVVGKREILDYIARVWIGCKPLLDRMMPQTTGLRSNSTT
jgi:hypothetical protein